MTNPSAYLRRSRALCAGVLAGLAAAALAAGCGGDDDTPSTTQGSGSTTSSGSGSGGDTSTGGAGGQGGSGGVVDPPPDAPTLVGFAALPAPTFAPGPTSGQQIGAGPVNLQPLPFVDKQPVQGFSALLERGDGSYLGMLDNGYGSMENSADFVLRVYTIRPALRTKEGGLGEVAVEGFIELSDPYLHVPFAITNFFTPDRVLTGADFDIESLQQAPDGTLWFGDEFGPYVLHTDATGRLLEPPIPLPDLDATGVAELRSPQNPMSEEACAVRVMNAARAHARAHGNTRTPVFSPWFSMLDDGVAATNVPSRASPPAGSGVTAASSEIFNVQSMHAAGYPVVTWTVNDTPTMTALLALGVDGIISDRPDLLFGAVAAFDANGDGTPGDLLDAEGLIDRTRFDAQSHRGGRNLRPENTLPAMEAGLDNLMSTLEMDTGITFDLTPVLFHDPHVKAQKCRRADGLPYTVADEVLIKDLTVTELQSQYICDKVFRGPEQLNDPALSPVTADFAAAEGMPHMYSVPTLDQVFRLVEHYIDYYKEGVGSTHPQATLRWRNALRVRFNIETKLNPRAQFIARTVGPEDLAELVAGVILDHGLEERADIQSFDYRTLLLVQEQHPEIRTVYLFGDFPAFADPTIPGNDEGTNLQDEQGANTPWLAGLPWPYRQTWDQMPPRVQRSGGLEGIALTPDGTRLLAFVEKPLSDAPTGAPLQILEMDLASRSFTGVRWEYALEALGTNVGEFKLIAGDRGLALERDESQGDLTGFKALFHVRLPDGGGPVQKELLVDLLHIADPHGLSPVGLDGDVGLGDPFAFPFITIESVVYLGGREVAIINDNNYPFSLGRHIGTGLPDDSELIVIDTGRDLSAP